MHRRDLKSIRDIEKRFRIITLLIICTLIVSWLIPLLKIDISVFFKTTFFIGLGIGVWFFSDYEMLREDQFYYRSLLIGIAFLLYCLMLTNYFANANVQLIDFGALYPLALLMVQRPTRKFYLSLLHREPKVEKFGSFADMIYTVILFIGIAVLPLLIMDAIK